MRTAARRSGHLSHLIDSYYSWKCHLDDAGQNKRVRLLEVSRAKTSPFGLLSALAIGAVAQVAKGEQVSMQSLAAALVTGQLQKAAFQNGVTPNGAAMAVMPDIQVSTPAPQYCLYHLLYAPMQVCRKLYLFGCLCL